MNELMVTGTSAVQTEKVRVDGKARRQYITVKFADAKNPLTCIGQRNFFQEHSADGKSAFWKGLNAEQILALKGTNLEGEITRFDVEAYEVVDSKGEKRSVNSYTIPILKGEYAPSVLKAAGHFLPGQKPAAKAKEASSLIGGK